MSKEQHAHDKFDEVFGKAGVVHEQTYFDPMRGVDQRQEIGKSLVKAQSDLQTKAPSIGATTGGTFTAYSLLPPFIDPSVVDRTVRETPLVRLLPRKAVRSLTYAYNLVTAKAGAAFLGDDAALSDQVDTRSNGTVTMKFLYAVGRITGPAQAGAQGFINLMAEDIRVKTASLNEALENEIINGNTSTNALGFTGLISGITTNTSNNSSANITLELIREDFNTSFQANGLIDLVVTDGYTFNYLKGLIQDYMRFPVEGQRLPANMDFGIPDAFYFDGALFIKDRYMPTTATAREILYLDTRYIYLAVLQDYTYQELAKTNDSDKYFIKWYGALVLTFQASCVRRYNLA